MQPDQLLELRSKIVQSTRDIALHGGGSEADRLQILMTMVRSGDADYEVYNRTFELSSSIQDDDQKLTAMLDLLYEVDLKLNEENQEGNSPE